ncbi:MAG: post-PEP-CTERM-1 domain-containing protein [Janthinobacterium lividum]
MSQHRHSGQRLLCAAGIIALLGLAQPALAQEATQEAMREAPQAAESLTVVKDAETGKLRAPTAAEAATLKAQADAAKSRMRAAPQQVLSKVHRSGLRGFRVTDESMSMSVAVRKPDGSIERQCFDTHGAGAEAVAKGHVHTTQAVTE